MKPAKDELMPFSEIARRMGLPGGAGLIMVYRAYNSAMRKLRKRVNHDWLLELLAPMPEPPGATNSEPGTPPSQWNLGKFPLSRLKPRSKTRRSPK